MLSVPHSTGMSPIEVHADSLLSPRLESVTWSDITEAMDRMCWTCAIGARIEAGTEGGRVSDTDSVLHSGMRLTCHASKADAQSIETTRGRIPWNSTVFGIRVDMKHASYRRFRYNSARRFSSQLLTPRTPKEACFARARARPVTPQDANYNCIRFDGSLVDCIVSASHTRCRATRTPVTNGIHQTP